MWGSHQSHASAVVESNPQGIAGDTHPHSIPRAPCVEHEYSLRAGVFNGNLRRSWYSQTFSDDECDDESGRASMLLTSPGGENETEIRGAGVFTATPPEACYMADNNSDASTDVGSDDEEGGKRLDEFEVDEVRSRPNSVRAASVCVRSGKANALERQPDFSQQLQVDVAEASSQVQDKSQTHEIEKSGMDLEETLNADELTAMRERRLLKRQRQRGQRRDQRGLERAARSAQRKR